MQNSRWTWLSWLSLVMAVGALALLGLSGPGYQRGWFDLGTALRQMLTWAAFGGLGAAVVALAALVLNGRRGGTGARAAALAALVVGLGTAYVPWQLQRTAQGVPSIHDISTDTIVPPEYVEIAVIRRELKANPLDYSADVARQQRTGYPDLKPLFLAAAPADAYRRALALVQARGWTVVTADEGARRIEATDATYWFGFKDDVAIRVSALPDGSSRVDMRSVSRVGRSDIGTNAKRIGAFLADLSQ